MRIDKTILNDCYVIHPELFDDGRGYFSPYFIKKELQELGFGDVVQANRSKSVAGVCRGLHYQEFPYTQAKVVNVVKGAAMVVVVDIRPWSGTYGQWINVLLTEENHTMMYVPKGFAHGFLAIENDTIYEYLVDDEYKPDFENGIAYNDPELDIPWDKWCEIYNIPKLILSEKDSNRLPLSQTEVIL